ncbi:MAG: trans-aconitate 2-methyltransferase [Pseudomonadales bacterium]
MPDSQHFDADYYRRFYEDPATRAGTVASARRQAAFIAAYLNYMELPVQRIVDLGCGMGRLLRALGRCYPKAQCVGVEYSSYLCKRYGWEPGTAQDYRSDQPFDLVVCDDVLSYLSEADCSAALANIANLCTGAAFIGLITAEDRTVADFDRTDPDQTLRPASWYRRRVGPRFQSVGGGLYLRKPAQVPMWTMDLGR